MINVIRIGKIAKKIHRPFREAFTFDISLFSILMSYGNYIVPT